MSSARSALVSAIVPTHNRAHCLPRAIESILGQEGAGEDFEVETIVVDDGSSDSTREVVGRHHGVRYLRLPRRQGVAAALNAGLRAATGRFITFLDDDDEWLPHKLRTQVSALAGHPEAGVIYGQVRLLRPDCEQLYPEIGEAPSGWVLGAMLLDNFCGTHAAMLVRREALEQAGGFDEALECCEDFDLSLRLARITRFVFSPGAVTIYNQSPTGLYLSRVADGTAAREACRVIEKALAMLPDSPAYEALKDAARVRVALETATSRGLVGDLNGAQERLLATLAGSPGAIRHAWARRYVMSMARKRVRAGQHPVAVVRDLEAQVRSVTFPHDSPPGWWQQLVSELQPLWAPEASVVAV